MRCLFQRTAGLGGVWPSFTPDLWGLHPPRGPEEQVVGFMSGWEAPSWSLSGGWFRLDSGNKQMGTGYPVDIAGDHLSWSPLL